MRIGVSALVLCLLFACAADVGYEGGDKGLAEATATFAPGAGHGFELICEHPSGCEATWTFCPVGVSAFQQSEAPSADMTALTGHVLLTSEGGLRIGAPLTGNDNNLCQGGIFSGLAMGSYRIEYLGLSVADFAPVHVTLSVNLVESEHRTGLDAHISSFGSCAAPPPNDQEYQSLYNWEPLLMHQHYLGIVEQWSEPIQIRGSLSYERDEDQYAFHFIDTFRPLAIDEIISIEVEGVVEDSVELTMDYECAEDPTIHCLPNSRETPCQVTATSMSGMVKCAADSENGLVRFGVYPSATPTLCQEYTVTLRTH